MNILANLFLNITVFFNDLLLQIPMADTFRSEGKIYVVVGIVLILLVGFFIYLWRIDRKIDKLEEELKNK
ncbi:CcmD family protein [Marinoscillum sp.]|uniref:CcmD family protein n=1 Tax=Marinoscillum sp. TaxID=2024838 RepID=UPI003BA9F24B